MGAIQHFLVVTETEDSTTEDPDYSVSVSCSDPANCDGWVECAEEHGDIDPDGNDEDVEIHGVLHDWQYGHGCWSISYPGCVVAWDFDQRGGTDSAWDIAYAYNAGRHEVDVEWGDWGAEFLYVQPAAPEGGAA